VDFDWTQDDVAYRSDIKAFLRELLPEGWGGYNTSDLTTYKSDSIAFCMAMARRGWLTQNWPKEYGGQDASPWRAAILSEELWPIGEPRGPQYMNANWIGPAIMAAGSEEQKLYHLRRISAGDVCWCQGFSEPDAGSDLPAMRTRAVRDGDDYVVNGTKIWTSHVGTADFCFLLVKTDINAPKRAGISILLTPMDTPGIEVRRIDGFVGEQAFHQLVFDDVRIPAVYRLGEENRGWDIVRRALAFERVGAAIYGTGHRILRAAIAEATRNGLLDDQEVQTKIGEVFAALEAARLLTYKVIDLRAHGSPPTADSNLSRVAQTSAVRAAGELAHLVFREEGLAAGSPGDIRRVLASSVAAGTTEMQLDQIASNYLALPTTF
jgi:alkylation response protein AidB-like acyl-CoA dehydrogenase